MIYRNGRQRIDYGPGPVGRMSMPGHVSGLGGALVSHVASSVSPTEQKQQRRAAAKRAWRAAHR